MMCTVSKNEWSKSKINRLNLKMKILIQITCMTVLLLMIGCNSKKDKLIGTWQMDEYADGVHVEDVTTYSSDGSSVSMGTFGTSGNVIYFVVGSTWKLSGDQLTEVITSSNIPELLPVGLKMTSTIISITDSEMVQKSMGELSTYYRVNK